MVRKGTGHDGAWGDSTELGERRAASHCKMIRANEECGCVRGKKLHHQRSAVTTGRS